MRLIIRENPLQATEVVLLFELGDNKVVAFFYRGNICFNIATIINK